jgi:hypothetical protein
MTRNTRNPTLLEKIKLVKQFSSDGCTMAPDLVFYDCCVAHDIYYATDIVSRKEADRHLKMCIAATGYKFLSRVYYLAVRIYGWIPYYFGKSYALRVSWQEQNNKP